MMRSEKNIFIFIEIVICKINETILQMTMITLLLTMTKVWCADKKSFHLLIYALPR